MFNFNEQRYSQLLDEAIALMPNVEATADVIDREGYTNLFFIGCGGTYAHSLALKYFLDTNTTIDSYSIIAAEFIAMGHRKFSKDSVCILSTRTGTTKEIVAAAKFCKEAGARVVLYVSHKDTPVCQYADYIFNSFAEDDLLAEVLFLVNIPFVARLAYRNNNFPHYDRFASQIKDLPPFLIKGKMLYEDRCRQLAEKHRNTDYHMLVGSGYLWGETYNYAMCILEEMQWIKTKSIHAAEFFHGTLELVELDSSIILFFGEDSTRHLTDRVFKFVSKISDNIAIFDTSDVELPMDVEFRSLVSPIVIASLTERLSCHLEHVRNHPLSTRRYYRQIEY